MEGPALQDRVLIVEDDLSIQTALRRYLDRLGYEVLVASTLQEGRQQLTRNPNCVAFVDFTLPDGNGAEFVRWGFARGLLLRAYCITGDPTSANVVAAIRAGCEDVIPKPFDLQRLSDLLRQNRAKHPLPNSWRTRYAPEIIGESPQIVEALTVAALIAQTESPVLVTGESGTGKELIARAIHEASDRRGRPFVALNCAAIPENLIESELFGHAKGAFTGATGPREGHILSADGGTLFLDEIGDMPLPAQAKLLRVLQEGKITPVGSDKPIPVDIRVVAATHQDLEAQIEAKTFRGDLFYRINVIRIELPALRDRKEDILTIATHGLRRINSKLGANIAGFDAIAEETLRAYHWPGNVRELLNVIQRAVLLKREGVISARDLRLPFRLPEPSPTAVASVSVEPQNLNLKSALDDLERQMLQAALDRSNGNRTEAAALLGLNRTTLIEKLRKLGMS